MSLAEVEKPRDPLASLRISRADPPRAPRSRGRWLRRLVIALVLIGLPAGGLVVASQKGWLNVSQSFQPKLEVRVATVNVETGRAGDAVVVATGYLESRRQAKIGARATGRIETLNVEEGSVVHKGQVLAILEHADLDASIAGTKATLLRTQAESLEQQVEISRAGRKMERSQKLRNSPAMAESAFDEVRFKHEAAVARLKSVEAAVALAEARVREAEQMKANMFVVAPFDGTVISKDAELGESIMPGGMGEASGRGSVVTIADLEHLEVDCDVKEDYIGRVQPGQTAEVAVDAAPDRRYQGRVRKIIPMGDRARTTIKVKVEILDADARLFPEMSSTVYFLPPETESSPPVAERRIFCLTDALVLKDKESYVWLVEEEDRVRRVDVKAGVAKDGQTEILEGLSGGEQVVVRPSADLFPDRRVRVIE